MKQENKFILINSSSRQLISDFCQKHKYLYRFLSVDRFLEMVYKNKMAFVSPLKWKDPLDRFLFKESEGFRNCFLHRVYVVCFTLTPHSQAYWKEYAPKGYGIRIKINSKNFFDSVFRYRKDCWFGKLNYVAEKTYIELLNNTAGLKNALTSDHVNNLFLNTFSYKRYPFRYENEVRFIIQTEKKTQSGLHWIEIEPDKLIDDIYIDPRMGNYETKMLKRYLADYFKDKKKVRKSQLFTDKKIIIQ